MTNNQLLKVLIRDDAIQEYCNDPNRETWELLTIASEGLPPPPRTKTAVHSAGKFWEDLCNDCFEALACNGGEAGY